MKHPADMCPGGLQAGCERLSLTCVLEVTWDVAASSPETLRMESSGLQAGNRSDIWPRGWIRSACLLAMWDLCRDAHLGPDHAINPKVCRFWPWLNVMSFSLFQKFRVDMPGSGSAFIPTINAITTSQDLQWMVQPTVITSMSNPYPRSHPYSPLPGLASVPGHMALPRPGVIKTIGTTVGRRRRDEQVCL